MSKALDKSINKAPAKPCLSRQNFNFSISVNKAYGVLKPSIYTHKNGERNFPIFQICFRLIHSNILETVDKTLTSL